MTSSASRRRIPLCAVLVAVLASAGLVAVDPVAGASAPSQVPSPDGCVGTARCEPSGVLFLDWSNPDPTCVATITVEWGDGSPQGSVTGSGRLTLQHRYEQPGTYTVTERASSNCEFPEQTYDVEVPPAACVRLAASEQFAEDAAVATEALAGTAGTLLFGYSIDRANANGIVRAAKGAMPTGAELVSHVQSHMTRAPEAGSWIEPKGNAAARAASAQQQVDEVLNAANRTVTAYTQSGTGKTFIEVSVPASEKIPKGRAIKFLVENGRLVFQNLGVQRALTIARVVESTVLLPASATALLAAGMTATASISGSAVAAANKRACEAERRRLGIQTATLTAIRDSRGGRSPAVSDPPPAIPSIPTTPGGVDASTAEQLHDMLANLAEQATAGQALERALERGSTAQQDASRAKQDRLAVAAARDLARSLRSASQIRARVAEFGTDWTVTIAAPAVMTEDDAAKLTRQLTPELERFGAPDGVAATASTNVASVLASPSQVQLAPLLRGSALDQYEEDLADQLDRFQKTITGGSKEEATDDEGAKPRRAARLDRNDKTALAVSKCDELLLSAAQVQAAFGTAVNEPQGSVDTFGSHEQWTCEYELPEGATFEVEMQRGEDSSLSSGEGVRLRGIGDKAVYEAPGVRDGFAHLDIKLGAFTLSLTAGGYLFDSTEADLQQPMTTLGREAASRF